MSLNYKCLEGAPNALDPESFLRQVNRLDRPGQCAAGNVLVEINAKLDRILAHLEPGQSVLILKGPDIDCIAQELKAKP